PGLTTSAKATVVRRSLGEGGRPGPTCARTLGLRDDLQDPPVGVVGEEIERAVGTLPYVADAPAGRPQVLEQPLLAGGRVQRRRPARCGAPATRSPGGRRPCPRTGCPAAPSRRG